MNSFWMVFTLLCLLGTLLLVVIVALVKYMQLSRIQEAIEHAWYNEGVCTGRMDELECRLHFTDDLHPFPNQPTDAFDRLLARRMADYVARVEMTSKVVPMNHVEVERFDPRIGPTFGIVWMEGSRMVIAFRATVTHSDFQNDLMAWQIDYNSGEKVETAKAEPINVPGARALVHSGFYRVMMYYLDAILETISKHKPSVIYLSGHSLGGAVATLIAVRISELIAAGDARVVSCTQGVVCYVFGTPRVGNATFDEQVQSASALKALWRVVNSADLIQELLMHVTPNFKKPNHHAFYYQHIGQAYTYTANWGSWQSNHFLPNYISHLT